MLFHSVSSQIGRHSRTSLAVLTLLAAQAWATAPAEGIRLALASGQLEQASRLLQQEKQRLPMDTELRFMEGVIQAQQGQTDKAIETFRKLTESNPLLVEAHNNLGVLYASKGRLEEARKAFEAGMMANASYAALHRNLADVQSQLVKQTYAKALQVDSKARSAVPQLSLLASIQPRGALPATDAVAAATPAAPRPTPAPVQAAASSTSVPPPSTPASAPASPPAAASVTAAASAPTVSSASPPSAQAASAPALVASAPTAGPQAPTPQASSPKPVQDRPKRDETGPPAKDAEGIRHAVLAWAKAWSRQDMDGYLKAYASQFIPPERMSRNKWEAERKQRILSKKSISVEVRQLKIKLEDKTATVQFQQIYSSDNFTGNSRKTLEMVKQGDRWLILRETVQ